MSTNEKAREVLIAIDKLLGNPATGYEECMDLLTRFASSERLDEAKWWENLQTHGVADCGGKCGMHKRIAALEQIARENRVKAGKGTSA
jgi:hypothetical protein